MQLTISPIAPLLILAVIIEQITERIKVLLPENVNPRVKEYVSIGVGMLMAFACQMSLFADVSGSMKVIGIVLTGLFCSRGSNYVHDLADMFKNIGNYAVLAVAQKE